VDATELCSELFVPELVTFLHGGLAAFLGTCSADLVPALTRAFAPRVAPDRRALDLFVGRTQAEACLANLGAGRPITFTAGNVVDYRGLQIKGVSAGWQDVGPADAAWVDDYWGLFVANCRVVELAAALTSRLRCRDLVRVTLLPRAIFRQTPGPGAGSAVAIGTTWA
jgi:hypothetical protein